MDVGRIGVSNGSARGADRFRYTIMAPVAATPNDARNMAPGITVSTQTGGLRGFSISLTCCDPCCNGPFTPTL